MTKKHYRITDNPSLTICDRLSDNTTRCRWYVTCKDCKKLIKSRRASITQFVSQK